ncbi:winged helix-turn-helix transcriptional regulator [Sporomusa sp.]|uniref:winged helix-turn-helix transcriptional regulator n=1 Tax=Sporomusa sp. TaxID=2078658 RepID=UPI002CB9056B|nr:winged helix-turn-helix transcriptional regulator [Sporomusa sp.]HWR43956.1 winged helix-turn-helix transcriptional regulator [Sporomusa sp.]
MKNGPIDPLVCPMSYTVSPPKVEYSLTEKGKTLIPILELMATWGAENCFPEHKDSC